MKIAYLTGSLSRSGAGVFEASRHWAKALEATGQVSVSALGLTDEYTADDRYMWQGVTTQTSPIVGMARYGYSPGLRHRLAMAKPDLLHLHGLWMYPTRLSLNWKSRTSSPLMVTPYGMLEPWALGHSRIKKIIMRWLQEDELLRRADCIHALSEEEAHHIRVLGIRLPIFIAPTGVPPNPLAVDTSQRSTASEKSIQTLLFLGRIHEKKGIYDLVRAWQAVCSGNASSGRWRLVIAGWGEPRDLEVLRQVLSRVPECCRPEHIGPKFDLDKWRLLGNSDAFILPSLSEGMPVAVLEAWAAGVPVLMTAECNLAVGFACGAGYRIEPGVEGISAGLRRLFDGNLPLSTMRKKAQELAQTVFDWQKIAVDTLAVFSWLKKESRRPACVHVI